MPGIAIDTAQAEDDGALHVPLRVFATGVGGNSAVGGPEQRPSAPLPRAAAHRARGPPEPATVTVRSRGSSIVSGVLDRDFFRREFPQKVQGFSDERESVPVRVVISTVGGRDFDVQRMTSNDTVATLYTREDKMIFLPHDVIEHIQVSVAEDRRVAGFEIQTESGDGT